MAPPPHTHTHTSLSAVIYLWSCQRRLRDLSSSAGGRSRCSSQSPTVSGRFSAQLPLGRATYLPAGNNSLGSAWLAFNNGQRDCPPAVLRSLEPSTAARACPCLPGAPTAGSTLPCSLPHAAAILGQRSCLRDDGSLCGCAYSVLLSEEVHLRAPITPTGHQCMISWSRSNKVRVITSLSRDNRVCFLREISISTESESHLCFFSRDSNSLWRSPAHVI